MRDCLGSEKAKRTKGQIYIETERDGGTEEKITFEVCKWPKSYHDKTKGRCNTIQCMQW